LDGVHISKMTTFEVEFEFREKEEVTRKHQVSMEAAEPLEYPFWSKLSSRRWQCDREHSGHAASKCPHAQFLGQNVVDGLVIQIQLTTDHSDCQMSIILHESPHVGHIFYRF
jgi:hypothetical protein